MNKRVWVISLGGSRIIPKDTVDDVFLERFKKILLTKKDARFVIVTGGGTTARKYMKALSDLHFSDKEQSKTGIAVTRFHATYLMKVIGKPANETLPQTYKEIKDLLRKNHIVVSGALRERTSQTTDGTAAKIAAYLNAPFINITNVEGLYTKNPKTHPTARLIKTITWEELFALTKKRAFKPGQHFITDIEAARVIHKKKVPTYIIGSLKALQGILYNTSYKGTYVYG